MFTGIIQHVGRVKSLRRLGDSARLEALAPGLSAELRPGDSVAVNGACLTVTGRDGKAFQADLSRETLERSNLGSLRSGDSVNLELPLLPTARLGGHFVQGHVDAVARVARIEKQQAFALFRFSLPPGMRAYVVEKGSIAVDGISLTVSGVGEKISSKWPSSLTRMEHTNLSRQNTRRPGESGVRHSGQVRGGRPEPPAAKRRQSRRLDRSAPSGPGVLTDGSRDNHSIRYLPRKPLDSFFSTIEEVIEDIRSGKMLIVVDDEDRENEGDLTIAAEKVTPEAINFMARFGRGLICLSLTGERLDELQIPLMVNENSSRYGTAFCVSIEARGKVSTGISAADRSQTILTAIHPETRPGDLVKPGHVFPLRARRGGVLIRAGQTEAAVDLARIAGLRPAGRHLRDHERRRQHVPGR